MRAILVKHPHNVWTFNCTNSDCDYSMSDKRQHVLAILATCHYRIVHKFTGEITVRVKEESR